MANRRWRCATSRTLGFNVVLVSSGAVGVGCQRLGLATKPTELAKKQALAAVGQIHLMRYYDDLFTALNLTCSQVLLTLDNLATRSQYINARNTFYELLRYGTLRFGDNDTLSAQVATLVEADWLFLLTDVDALYTGNPNTDPTAEPVREVDDVHDLAVDTRQAGTQWGTGGMATKLTAAAIATAAGCRMAICHFKNPGAILDIIAGEDNIGTVFNPLSDSLKGRKRWILSVPTKGEVWVDDGAARALKKHASLFAAGVTEVKGTFHQQDAVKILDSQGKAIAHGLVNYTSEEMEASKGLCSKAFLEQLGYQGQEEVINRANICLLVKTDQAKSMRRVPSRGSVASSRAPSPAGPEVSYGDGTSESSSPVDLTPPSLSPKAHEMHHSLSEADIIARLSQLRSRAELAHAGTSDDWSAQMAAAMQAELRAVQSARDQPAASGEDIDEGGWLPK
ncbi:hypothetical protein QBZ16_004010 [Prototheca wickerhamii]|uniref:PUA domain-containing protein n=1 Tax=Prototheca wickerhamii TaxID=3111 RepID=A0AAD9IL07_PROWI|nr:hypothetical protein QBZ16_004010 [Prototheca wickerhamii]